MTHMRPESTSAESGLSLVEVVIALVILSVGILAVAGLSSTSVTQVQSGFNLTNSTIAAQQVMDGYIMTPFDSVSLGATTDTVSLGGQNFLVVSTVTDVSNAMAVASPKVIYKVVVYSGGGAFQRNGERFETLLFNGFSQ